MTGYHLVTQGVDYQDLGRDYFDKRNQETIKRRAVKRLEQLGYQVDLTPVPALAG